MKKVYLFLTAICLTALTGCIKEEPFQLEEVSLSVSLDTRSSATKTQEQGDKIEDAMLWAFKCTIDENNGMPVVSDPEIKATGWRYIASVSNTYKELENIHIPLDVCVQGDENASIQQSYVLFAVINTKAFDPNFALGSKTTYKALTEAVFANGGAFWNKFPQSVYDEDGKLVSATPEVMPVSNWATFTVETNKNNTNKNTHNGNCHSLTLPVYRAVAKTQLYMRKSSEDFTLTVLGAEVVSSEAPANGAMFTKQDFATSTHATKTTDHTNATNYKVGTFGYPNQTDGLEWWKTPTFGTAKVFSLKNSESATDSFSDLTVTTFAEDTYEWVASTFLLENDQNIVVNDNYSQVTTDGGGYYMAVTYQIDDQEVPYIGYVPMPYVVRNHDYHVNATVDAGGELTLKINVLDWTEQSAQLDFKDYVTFSKSITWADGTNFDSNNNHIVTLGSARGDNATFSFKLDAPVGGTWYAELITKQGKANAFSFSNTAVEATTSGEIGKEANLTIYTTAENFGAETENVAELRITARGTIGGVERTFRVDMGTEGNYQIEQAN